MSEFRETVYSPWYLAQCQQRCSTLIGGTKRPNVLLAAKDHVRETGHETAVIRTSSVHFRPAAKS